MERDNEVMNLVTVRRSDTMLLVWSPTPGAVLYGVLRAFSEDPYQYALVGTTSLPFYVDEAAPDASVRYVVVVLETMTPAPPAGATPQRNACVSASATGATVTASNCLPSSIWAKIEL